MAVSVLGKRQRQSTLAEDPAPALRSRKRRALDSTPTIYSDSDGFSKTKTPQDAGSPMDLDDLQPNKQGTVRSTATHNELLKHTVQNKRLTVNLHTATTIPALFKAVIDENTPPVELKTPSTTRFKDVWSSATPKTPRRLVRLCGKPLTPRTPRNLPTPTSKTKTVYAVARDLFTQSASPRKLIGRETERTELRSFISEAINSMRGGCTYVSGPPGTGKSALIDEVSAEFKSNPLVKVAAVNCVGIKAAKEVYGKLVQDLGLDALSSNSSERDQLGTLFVPKKKSGSPAYLVLLDEIDSLLDGDCEVLYSLFEWALHRSSRLILIGIANALDLTDRFLPRLKARNLQPRLLPFLPYTARQIASIVTEMLRSTLPVDSTAAPDFIPFLHPAAVQLSSKKVASQSGDLRKVFSLVRRAVDQIERETVEKAMPALNPNSVTEPLAEMSNLPMYLPPTPPKSSPLKATPPIFNVQLPLYTLTPATAPRATVAHIARLASSIFNNGTASRLGGLNLQQKAILCSLIAAEKKKAARDPFTTPSKSVSKAPTMKDLYAKYSNLCTRDEGILQPLMRTDFRDVMASLETLGLVRESMGRTSSFLTPSKTPSRLGRNPDEREMVSAVSEKEMLDSLRGAGADLLRRLMYES